MHIDLNGSFADYWACRPKKVAQNMARYRRRMDAGNLNLRFVFITTSADMLAAVARYASLEADGWKGGESTAIDNAHGQQPFYEEVMSRHAAQLWPGNSGSTTG